MRALIAIDGSAAAERAVELTGAIEWPAGTQLRVVSVVEPIDTIIAAQWVIPAGDQDPQTVELGEQAEVVLEQAVRELGRTGMEVSHRVMHGRPASQIVDGAREFAADLIIIGSRGHGTIASMILGSVSAEVVDHAPCPVLIARSTRLTRAVLAHDGSPLAMAAENLIARWPIFANVAIEVTNVAQVALPWTSGLALSAYDPPPTFTTEMADAIINEHRPIAQAATVRLLEAGRVVSERVVEGDAATELMAVAEADLADLIVLGTHGRTGLARLVMGSVARNVVLHASCSVLVVRQNKTERGSR